MKIDLHNLTSQSTDLIVLKQIDMGRNNYNETTLKEKEKNLHRRNRYENNNNNNNNNEHDDNDYSNYDDQSYNHTSYDDNTTKNDDIDSNSNSNSNSYNNFGNYHKNKSSHTTSIGGRERSRERVKEYLESVNGNSLPQSPFSTQRSQISNKAPNTDYENKKE